MSRPWWAPPKGVDVPAWLDACREVGGSEVPDRVYLPHESVPCGAWRLGHDGTLVLMPTPPRAPYHEPPPRSSAPVRSGRMRRSVDLVVVGPDTVVAYRPQGPVKVYS